MKVLFSKDMLIGILLSKAKFEIQINNDSKSRLGYSTKLKINIRGEEDFLLGVQRSLLQHNITSHYKKIESKSRQKPILKISGVVNMTKVKNMIPKHLPDSNNEWKDFSKAIKIMNSKGHLTLDGFDALLKIKGLI